MFLNKLFALPYLHEQARDHHYLTCHSNPTLPATQIGRIKTCLAHWQSANCVKYCVPSHLNAQLPLCILKAMYLA